jgi:DNA polymerase I
VQLPETFRAGSPVALAVVPGVGIGLARGGERWAVAGDPATLVRELTEKHRPRWVWWDAATTARPLVDVRIGSCWDLAAVHRLIYGGHRADPAVAWAAARGLDEPEPRRNGEPTLFDEPTPPADSPVLPGGQLHPEWCEQSFASPDQAASWAELAWEVYESQQRIIARMGDPRVVRREPKLCQLTAYAESAAALLAVELEHDGLPLDRAAAEECIAGYIGPRPADSAEETALRVVRDQEVLTHWREGTTADLRNPAQVGELLAKIGIVVPDTRSWRLEPFRSTHPGVAALLDWRKAERVLTTYGYRWLDRHVGLDGRLRGGWGAADGGAGRMTAQAGLHNLPASHRVAVRAEPGYVLVRADLGQIEPRVLAAVSGDVGLTAATQSEDLYAPVAAQIGTDRPTAKVAVLAAMYGQTSGSAGAALKRMERAYPYALAYLRAAEEAGRAGRDIRTWGGRRLRLSGPGPVDPASIEPLRIDESTLAAGAVQGLVTGAGRFARNAVIQGAAAELFKAWAASVRACLLPLGGRIVLCLHDELLVHVPAEHGETAARLVTDTLTSTAAWWAAGSGVHFVADVSVVDRWSDAK